MKPNAKKKSLSLEIKNVSKHYGMIEAIKNVSFETTSGEIIALLGPNGAGKSTLMNMIAGYLAPSEGKISVNGNDVEQDDVLTKRDIGFLPEGAPMYGDMSVVLFLKYFIELKLNLVPSENLSMKEIKKTYQKELQRVMQIAKIENVATQKIDTLSKGYQRRVGFAASLIGNPPILLLDEPTDGLDPNQKDHMRQLIKKMSKDKTILISTHLLDEAEDVSSKIILINKGQIAALGTLEEILKQTKKETLGDAFKFLTKQKETAHE